MKVWFMTAEYLRIMRTCYLISTTNWSFVTWFQYMSLYTYIARRYIYQHTYLHREIPVPPARSRVYTNIKTIGCPEMSVQNYHFALHNIPE